MLKLMGKKLFTIYAKKCFNKPVDVHCAVTINHIANFTRTLPVYWTLIRNEK